MELVIDVGNSNIVFGLYEGDQLLRYWRVGSDRGKTEDEYAVLFRHLLAEGDFSFSQISGVIISSVVPPLIYPLERMGKKYLGLQPVVIGPGIRTGLNIKTENPREVGADRIVNAVAALELYGPPVIIVDFGTATTFCAVNEHSEYLGGAIAPGIGISTEALFQRTAQLPRVELLDPGKVIGRHTIAAMQAGIYYGFVGQVEGIVKQMIEEMQSSLPVQVVATGGLAGLIAVHAKSIQVVNPLLTLQGLHMIYQRNLGRHHL